jgi:hypothetical protein
VVEARPEADAGCHVQPVADEHANLADAASTKVLPGLSAEQLSEAGMGDLGACDPDFALERRAHPRVDRRVDAADEATRHRGDARDLAAGRQPVLQPRHDVRLDNLFVNHIA